MNGRKNSPEGKKRKEKGMAGMFEGRTALITGGCHGIGRACSQAFRKEGAEVFVIDLSPDADFTGDIGKKKDLEAFADLKTAATRNFRKPFPLA